MRETVNEVGAVFNASLERSKDEARSKVNEETKQIRQESWDRVKPVLDAADFIWNADTGSGEFRTEVGTLRKMDAGRKTFDFMMDGACVLAEAGDFLGAGRILDFSWFRQPSSQGPTREIRERSMNELIGQAYGLKGALAAEELVRVLSWLGTGADLGNYPDAVRIINEAIDELKKVEQPQRAFELAAYWQISTYSNTPVPVTKNQVEGLFALSNGL
jgi:hypothetical protein